MRLLIVAAVVLAAAPLALPLFAMTLLTEALILGLLAMSLDLMVGYTRLVSFGHAAAYGLGAYASGYLLLHTSLPLPFAVLAASALTGVVAIGVAWVCTLAKGVSFSMLTLAFAQLLYAVAFKWTSVTGASDGLAGIPRRAGPVRDHACSRPRTAITIWCWCACLGAYAFCRSLVQLAVRGCACAAFARTRQRPCRLATTRAFTRSRWWRWLMPWAGLRARSIRRSPGFANTELLFWLFSGQVLIMVIVGGQGTLRGADPGCGVLHAAGACAEPLHQILVVVLWPDLHRVRDVCAEGHLGLLTRRARA